MKKIFCTIFILLVSLFSFSFAFAQTGKMIDNLKDVGKKGGYKTSGVTEVTFAETIGNVIQTMLGLLGIIFALLIIYGGFMWMIAGGDESKISKSKDIIKNAAIGLGIIVFSLIISQFIMSLFEE